MKLDTVGDSEIESRVGILALRLVTSHGLMVFN